MAQIFFSNLGCKLNQAEVEALARRFESDGHHIVGSLQQADVHLVNSCTVTHAAARDSRKLARRGARMSGSIRTVLTGCYATDSLAEASTLEGVSLVVPNEQKDDLVDHLYRAFPEIAPDPRPNGSIPVAFVPLEFGNTRGAIKVEDGCNMTCSFCIIPSTRGRQKSRRVTEVVEELRQLVEGGYQEIVVTGVQISSYRDAADRLVDLVRTLLKETRIPRLRLSSIAPWQFDLALLDLWPDSRLCRHFHLSLQSGSNDTLRRMRRPYSTSQYLELLSRLRERVEGVAITTDVIVGFPGETEREFQESLRFVEHAGFARTHVFPYSERSGTRSAEMADSVGPLEKKARVKAMREIAASQAGVFADSQIGKPMSVLWERELESTSAPRTLVVGTSDNYLRVQGFSAPTRRPGALSTEVAQGVDGAVLQLDGSSESHQPVSRSRVRLPVLG